MTEQQQQHHFDPELLTDEQLYNEIITADYHGAQVKRLALKELIARAKREADANSNDGDSDND